MTNKNLITMKNISYELFYYNGVVNDLHGSSWDVIYPVLVTSKTALMFV